MYDVTRVSRARCLLTWLVATALAAALLGWLATDLAPARAALTGPGPLPAFDTWLTWLCALAAAACALWGWLVTTVVVLEALVGRRRQVRARGVPGWVRRLVLAVCGAAVLAAAPPAAADERAGERPRGQTSVLEGLPLPDRAEGRSVSDLVATAVAETSATDPGPGHHRVRPGDSLWSIAASALVDVGARATAAEVAAYWPRVYELNRALVGRDPDLLRPGQLLRLPDPPIPTRGPTTGEDTR